MLFQWGGFAINEQVVAALIFLMFLLGTFYVQMRLAAPYRLRRKPRGKTARPRKQ